MIIAENQTMPTYSMHEKDRIFIPIDGIYIDLEGSSSAAVRNFRASYLIVLC